MQQRRAFLMSVAAMAAASCKKSDGGSGGKPRIAVIPKGTTHEYWKTVHAGAVKASREDGLDLVWKGPMKEDDLKSQIELVQSFVAQKVSGIVLAPLSDKGLKNPVKAAKAAGIPVVIFDSGLQGGDFDAFVATDNLAAGRSAGEHMIELLGGKGKVVLLRYQEGSASTMRREEGFLEAVRGHEGIEVVSDNQHGGATTESAFSTGESLLTAMKAGSGGVDGIFTPNESTTFGMLLALRKANLAGKVKFIGFDASDKLVAGIEQGHLSALVLQNPFEIGYLSVKTMGKLLRNEQVAPRVDTGSTLVTRANRQEPRIRRLLEPDLDKWLGK